MPRPLLSVVIPTFNAHAKLARTLDSIRAQRFDSLEIVVQDGSSNDETPQFLAAQSDVIWKSERDAGVYDAMNHAIALSSGQFLMFLGAGDELKAGALEPIAPILREPKATDAPLFLYGDAWWRGLERRYDGPFTQWKMTSRNVCHQAIFYDRRIFDRLGLYSLDFPINADWALNIAVFGDNFIEKRWVDWVVCDYEGGGLSSSARDEAFLEDLPRLIDEHFSLPVRLFYRLRRASPRGIKRWGAPIMRRLGWAPNDKMRAQMPGEKGD